MFKQKYARVQLYRLFVAKLEGAQITDLAVSRYIEKRELNLLRACELKPNELEYAAFTATH
jgi:hypothetical protein